MNGKRSDPTGRLRTVEIALPEADDGATLGTRVPVVTVLDGPASGEIFILENDVAYVGRDPSCDLVVGDAGVSTRHFRIARLGPRCYVEDLRSTNGTFVNRQRIDAPAMLEDGDRIYLGRSTVIGVRFHEPDEVVAIRRLYENSVLDALTGLYTRRHFDTRLTSELAFATRHGTRVTLILLDIDHFKRVNDTYGHPAGDAVLKAVGALLLRQVRTEDIPCRFGGEEFAVIARGIEAGASFAFAERLRNMVARLEVFSESGSIHPTASFGVAVSPVGDGGSSCADLIARADRALYAAKEGGRNRVCLGE